MKKLKSQTVGNKESGVIVGEPGSLIEEMSIVAEESAVVAVESVAVVSGRSPEVIAAEINMIKSQTAGIIETLSGHIRSGVYEIGRLLCEAKAAVPRGSWGEWLERNVNYSDSTAQNLMRIYRELDDGQVDLVTGKTQAELFCGLEYSQMVEVLKLPKRERAQLAAENDLASMSSREVKALVKEKTELMRQVERNAEERRAEREDFNSRLAAKDAERDELKRRIEAKEGEISELTKAADRAKLDATAAKAKAAEDRDKDRKRNNELCAKISELQKELEGVRESVGTSEPDEEEIERIRAEAIAETEEKYQAELKQLSFDNEKKIDEIKAAAEAEAEKRIAEAKERISMAQDETVKIVGVYIEQLNDTLIKIEERVNNASSEISAKLRGAVSELLSTAAEMFKSN